MKNAMEIVLEAELLDATQAQSYSLINAVMEPQQLDTEVERRVQTIIAGAPLAVMLTKQMMHQGLDAGFLANAFNLDSGLLRGRSAVLMRRKGPPYSLTSVSENGRTASTTARWCERARRNQFELCNRIYVRRLLRLIRYSRHTLELS